jgi:hypothetical protein
MLSNNHWVLEEFSQRMTTKEWKQILLDEQDKIIFKGYMRRLVAKRLGAGVVEVSKKKPDKDD